ncbi:MAG: hypothetical protein JW837_04180 [Sedimentisphaerales bacterium]|nr:hypothetical protein [Sedimentisphaerales bacterium]
MPKLPFFKKKSDKIESKESSAEPDNQPKYSKPKIILIDLPSDTLPVIKEKGYNVISGSFGHPYKIRQSSYDNKVLTDAKLPNYTEQEIIVIDLSYDFKTAEGEIPTDYKDTGLCTERSGNIIDPRPFAMIWRKRNSERIINHGGIFVIFAEPRESLTYYNPDNREDTQLYTDNWCFLSCLNESHIKFIHDNGHEVQIEDAEEDIIKSVLAKHIKEIEFSCILERDYETNEENWITLANNKFGQIISAAIFINTENEKRPSWVLIFPHMKDKAGFLLELIENALPAIAPYLFPFSEKTSWLYERTYELPRVNLLKDEIEQVKKDYEGLIDDKKQQIEKHREEDKFLYDLLSQTDEILVEAVIKALGILGFKQVIDVDKEIKESGESRSRREDIQIKDDSQILIIDVKGIANLPSDPDVMQSHKHATIRMKEWNRTDIKPLTIINHQRYLPPLDRDNKQPFRAEIVTAASQNDLGLMTTWDLYRLVRSFLRNSWKHEHVKPIFYRPCRMPIIPENYEYVGVINQIWPKKEAFSVLLEKRSLGESDKIALETPVEIIEYDVISLQIEGKSVQQAMAAVEVGIRTKEFPSPLKKGYRVYKINNNRTG